MPLVIAACRSSSSVHGDAAWRRGAAQIGAPSRQGIAAGLHSRPPNRTMASTFPPVALTAARTHVARTLAAGATVGVLDGLAAWLLYVVVLQRTSAERLFQGIARAAIGDGAFAGGGATAALGLLLHFTVAFGWATAYALLYRRWSGLRRFTRSTGGALVAGAALGAVVWFAMTLVVLPATHARPTPVRSGAFLTMLAIHMAVVGSPITLLVRDQRPR